MTRGFFVVITLDRLEELRKFLVSLSKFHADIPVCIYLARDVIDVFRCKTKAAFLTPFEHTVVIDTDIYVNGNLDYLFEVAEKGKIGIVRHSHSKQLNCGLICFSKFIMQPHSKKWNDIYEEKVKQNKIVDGLWDQPIFNELAAQMPIEELPIFYNATFHDISPEHEKKMWDKTKIFHFLHSWPKDKNKFRSYKLYMEL